MAYRLVELGRADAALYRTRAGHMKSEAAATASAVPTVAVAVDVAQSQTPAQAAIQTRTAQSDAGQARDP